MRTSDTIEQLAAALTAAQAEMPNAAFNKTNPHFRSKYADLAAIREATLPSLTKNGLSIVQGTSFREETFCLFSRLLHKSGEWIESEFPILIGSPQSMGSQLTYAKRYLWSAQAGVAADDDDDANAAQASYGVARETLDGPKELSKAKSRSIYDALIKEMRAKTKREDLTAWALENTGRIYSMHGDFQRFFREDYQAHLTTIAEGVTETGEVIEPDPESEELADETEPLTGLSG